jgi:DNA-binding IclR family transcriptional regulator
MAGRTTAPGASVTARALALLDAFDIDHPRLTLSQMAQRAGLPLSTAHRLARELELWQGLHRVADGRWEIGQRLWTLGMLAPIQLELRHVALPLMQDLHVATGENVHLAVREATSALYVERISGSRSVPIISRAGDRLPLHATGVGKVLLAHAEPDLIDNVLAHLTRVTEYTITEPGRMRRELAEVRKRRYARTSEEMTLGTCSVAVPVHDRDGVVVAALGLVVPSRRRDLARLAPALEVAARSITRRMSPYD